MTAEEQVQRKIDALKEMGTLDTNKISDGYHTFGELYDHRIALFILLCNVLYADDDCPYVVWKSKKHSDGSEWDGWFIAGINEKKGEQITYHLPVDKWDLLLVHIKQKAPKWDGHTSDDVLERLLKL